MMKARCSVRLSDRNTNKNTMHMPCTAKTGVESNNHYICSHHPVLTMKKALNA